MIGIYKITAPDGKIYIGQAKNIEHRWFNYRTKNRTNRSHPRLYPSFDTFGVENHKFEVIENCPDEMLNIRERYWQDFFDVLGENGMNCRLTSTPEKKGVLREEQKISMIAKMKGRKMSPVHKANVLAANAKNKGMKRNPEFIAKTVATRLANKKPHPGMSIETRIKMSQGQKGKSKPPRSEDHLKNLSIAQQKRYATAGPTYQSKTVLNTQTGVYYDSAKEAAFSEGLPIHSLCRMLNGKSKKRQCSLIYA